jgi:hypothetical protein
MGRYIVLYSAPLSVAERFAQAAPEEAAKGVELWVNWGRKLGPALIDPGKPFGRAAKVTRAGSEPIDSTVIGMSILEARTMDDALAMVDGHHHLHWADHCEITVLEEMAIPEMQGVQTSA